MLYILLLLFVILAITVNGRLTADDIILWMTQQGLSASRKTARHRQFVHLKDKAAHLPVTTLALLS